MRIVLSWSMAQFLCRKGVKIGKTLYRVTSVYRGKIDLQKAI